MIHSVLCRAPAFSETYIRTVWPKRSPADVLSVWTAGVFEVSPGSRAWVSRRAVGIVDYARLYGDSRERLCSGCLTLSQGRWCPDCHPSAITVSPSRTVEFRQDSGSRGRYYLWENLRRRSGQNSLTPCVNVSRPIWVPHTLVALSTVRSSRG
jgi:hypothetical protein